MWEMIEPRLPRMVRRLSGSLRGARLSRAPFYARHPYTGRLSLHSVDWHTVVDTDLRAIFHRVPKVANSSLLASFKQLSGGQAATGQAEKRALRDAVLKPSMLPMEQAAEAGGYYKFFVGRDPYDRVLSAFLSKVLRRGRGTDFGEFCRYLADGGLYANGHWTPQTEFLTFPVEEYDFIGRFENLAADFATIAQRLVPGTGVRMIAEDASHATHAGNQRDEHYTPALYDLVFDIYRADFDALGYERR